MTKKEARLIDANVCIKDLTAMKSAYDAISLDGMIKALKEASTIDPESLRAHGEWIGEGMDTRCSRCGDHPLKDMDGDSVWYWSYKPTFCPNCGARMR